MLPILLLLASSSILALPTDGGEGCILIEAVMPAYGTEMFSLGNHGDAPVELRGLRITDGEGVLTIEAHHLLFPGESVNFLSGELTVPLKGRSFLFPSDEVSSKGRFILADTGDEISVHDGDALLDAFVYGGGDASIPGWSGAAFPRIGKGKAAIRLPGTDSDSSTDWMLSSLGRSQHEVLGHRALVEPFLFPDDAYFRIMREITSVDREICISIYQIGNLSIAAALAELALAGKEVRILMEGSPVGGVSEKAQGLMAALADAGCDIRLIRSEDGFKRYDYLHNKYAVIDHGRVLVTSENWQDSSMTSNRGWGMSIRSQGLAGQLREVFMGDFAQASPDIIDFRSRYPDAPAAALPAHGFTHPPSLDLLQAEAEASILLCPDNAFDGLRSMIEGASRRVYAQQFYTQLEWLEGDRPLAWMMGAADRGADAKVMLDSSWLSGSKDNGEVVSALSSSSLVQAQLAPSDAGFTLVHNKGLVVDDAVMVSSINWVDASLFQNREIGIVARGEEVSAFFARAFLDDWGEVLEGFSVSIRMVSEGIAAGRPLILQAEAGGGVASSHAWELGEVPLGSGPRQVLSLEPGLHLVTLTVRDDLGRVAVCTLILDVPPAEVEEGEGWLLWTAAPLFGIPVGVIVVRLAMARRGRSRQQY